MRIIKALPGESLKLHITPVDVFFYVLEGAGVVDVGDERATVSRDRLIISPARIPHRRGTREKRYSAFW